MAAGVLSLAKLLVSGSNSRLTLAMRNLLFICLTILTALALQAEVRRPNIVFFLVDDLGYMDIGANNPKTFYETPNIDQLARSGMRFSNGYAANPVCSPTRFSIMTGKYPSRADATNFFSGRRPGKFLPAPLYDRMDLSEVTLAEAFKEAGYLTAFLGKWHLGPTEEFWPTKQGFDINIGGHNRGSPPGGYFGPFNNPRLENLTKDEHLPARLGDEALKIIDRFKDGPFLLYFSFYSVHTPLQGRNDLIMKYQAKAERLSLVDQPEFGFEEQVLPGGKDRRVRILQRHATYAAMVEIMDTQVGRVMDRLRKLNLDRDTIICFTSDNGGLATSEGLPTSNFPLRGGKGWLYEGGIREPYLISWPGVTKPGSLSTEPVISTDFYPTLLEIAGLNAKPKQHLDGVSLVPLLQGTGGIKRKNLFWHYPHYSNQGGFPGGAVREGDWKLIERFEDGSTHLYNLKEDIHERSDLAKRHPKSVDQLRAKLHAWYKQVDAKFLQARENGPKPWQP